MNRTTSLLAAATIVLTLILGTVPAAAQQATPAPIALPAVEAPYGLGRLTLPQTEGEILALFAQMPATVAGQTRAAQAALDVDRILLTYGAIDPGFGPPLFLQAIDFTRNDFFPDGFTTGVYIASVVGIPDFGALTYGQEGEIAWVIAASNIAVVGENEATPVVQRPIYTLTWGYADSSWLFSAAAATPNDLEALAYAVVLTASAHPAGSTPAAAT